MTPPLARFRAAYERAFRRYLEAPGEGPLHAAYELGREAVGAQLSVLDLALVHHEALLEAAEKADGASTAVVRAAGEFFVESVSAFDMVRRGAVDARASVALERRHAAILRRLSGFLADASLAAGASDSLLEMLRLVAEQARELTAAPLCVVSLAGGPGAAARVVAHDDERFAPGFAARLDTAPLDALAQRLGGPLRLPAETLRHELGEGAPPVLAKAGGWVAAPLQALDGRELGWMHLLGPVDAGDEAIVVQLAEMASAAVERGLTYRRLGPRRA